MRKELKKYTNRLVTITGNFQRYGVKDSDTSKWSTAVLTNIYILDGNQRIYVSDHMWFVLQKDWLKTELVAGSKVKVTGKVKPYLKKNNSIDYGLVETRNLIVLQRGKGKIQPAKVWGGYGYRYYKFLTPTGPRWYKVRNGEVNRISYKYIAGEFIEIPMEMEPNDQFYIDVIE